MRLFKRREVGNIVERVERSNHLNQNDLWRKEGTRKVTDDAYKSRRMSSIQKQN